MECKTKGRMMNGNIILGDCLVEMKKMKEGTFDLVIADPPYFKVVGEKWDYQWRTEEDYIEWAAQWLSEVFRVLRYGGTFYLFGYFRILSLLVSCLNSIGFELRQQIIINKGMKTVAGRATRNYRIFPNVTESILFLTKKNISFSRAFLKERQRVMGLTSKQINERLGVKANGGGMWSIYTGRNICEQFPTRELWEKLQEILDFDLQYEKVAQTFNPELGITDVWDDINFYEEKRLHPTQKPLKLIERLIRASSNEGDSVLDPFGGSGSTLIACRNLNRSCSVIELNEKYMKLISQRLTADLNGHSAG